VFSTSIFEPPLSETPNTKLQAPKQHQAPSSKTDLRAFGLGTCTWGLVFEIWNFAGAWSLEFGIWSLLLQFTKVWPTKPDLGNLTHR